MQKFSLTYKFWENWVKQINKTTVITVLFTVQINVKESSQNVNTKLKHLKHWKAKSLDAMILKISK